jgi:hypothetical protein
MTERDGKEGVRGQFMSPVCLQKRLKGSHVYKPLKYSNDDGYGQRIHSIGPRKPPEINVLPGNYPTKASKATARLFYF